MEIDYKHTLTVNKNAWYIKFYIWLWKADIENVNFCKLFWAYLFAIPFLIILPFLYMFLYILKGLKLIFDPIKNKILDLETKSIEKSLEKERNPKTPKRQKFLTKVANFFSKLFMSTVFQKFIDVMLFVMFILVVLIGMGLIVAAFLSNFWVTFTAIICALIGLAIAIGTVTLFRLFIEDGYGMGFFSAIKTGYVSVKSNTCPKIEVK